MVKIVLFTPYLVPKQEFIDCVKSLGYENYKDIDCRLDPKFVKFIEDNIEKYAEYLFYKGEKNLKKMCGFDGVAYIREVDLSRKWTIGFHKREIFLTGEYESISYVEVEESKNNYIEISYI